MKLIVGLGNPGKKYESTRHNVGFDVIDSLFSILKIKNTKEKFNTIYEKYEDVIIAKPQTFMNASGDAVQAIMHFFKIQPEDVLVIYDDMNHGVGKISIKTTGTAGGQNGLKDIIEKIGTSNINRIKIGIGRGEDSVKHVLGNFSKDERIKIDQVIEHATSASQAFINKDINFVMNKFNIQGKEL